MGFEPINCYHTYLDSLVFCLMLIGKLKKIAGVCEIGEIFHLCFTKTFFKACTHHRPPPHLLLLPRPLAAGNMCLQ